MSSPVSDATTILQKVFSANFDVIALLAIGIAIRTSLVQMVVRWLMKAIFGHEPHPTRWEHNGIQYREGEDEAVWQRKRGRRRWWSEAHGKWRNDRDFPDYERKRRSR